MAWCPQDADRSHKIGMKKPTPPPPEKTKLPPSRKWKEKYECHENKGDHTYELIKPHHSSFFKETREMTVEEYYAHEDAECEKYRKRYPQSKYLCMRRVLFHYACTGCGSNKVTLEASQ